MATTTIDTILDYLKSSVEQRHPIGPEVWLDAAGKLTILLGDEHAKLFDLEQKVAQLKATCLTEGKSVAAAKVAADASDIYKEARMQGARIENIQEMIRIAKIQSRLTMNDWNNQK